MPLELLRDILRISYLQFFPVYRRELLGRSEEVKTSRYRMYFSVVGGFRCNKFECVCVSCLWLCGGALDVWFSASLMVTFMA